MGAGTQRKESRCPPVGVPPAPADVLHGHVPGLWRRPLLLPGEGGRCSRCSGSSSPEPTEATSSASESDYQNQDLCFFSPCSTPISLEFCDTLLVSRLRIPSSCSSICRKGGARGSSFEEIEKSSDNESGCAARTRKRPGRAHATCHTAII